MILENILNIICLGKTLQGRSHLTACIPCQDKFFKLRKNGVSVMALADGAGSALRAEDGARIVAEKTCSFLCRHFESALADNGNKFPRAFIRSLRQSISWAAKISSKQRHHYASTIMGVAVCGDFYVAVHIGDGVIGALEKETYAPIVISHPDRGEFANATVFLTSPSASKQIRIYTGSVKNFEGFIVMTDGAMESLYNKSESRLAPAAGKMLEWMGYHDPVSVQEALSENMKEMLLPATGDDCGLGLMKLYRPKDFSNISKKLMLTILHCDNEQMLWERLKVMCSSAHKTYAAMEIEKCLLNGEQLLNMDISIDSNAKKIESHEETLRQMGLIY